MPTFISLVEYTAEGVQNMDRSPERLDAAREVVESMGGELHEFYRLSRPSASGLDPEGEGRTLR